MNADRIAEAGHLRSFATKATDPDPLSRDAGLRFLALDGFELGGRIFEPVVGGHPKTVVAFVGGGGVPARRYGRLARFLASNEIPVLTFDYRGIGWSRPRQLRGFRATAQDWGSSDVGGAIAEVARRYPAAQTAVISHSIGGLLLGAAPNTSIVRQFVFLCPHTGYWGDYRARFRFPMFALWHMVMPVLTHAVGYFPANTLRLGEDIPKDVALQWSRRRRAELSKTYRTSEILTSFAGAAGPALLITMSDDGFATAKGAERLITLYENLVPQRRLISPDLIGVPKIGHFGFFRGERAADLWPIVVEFLYRGGPGIQ